MSIKEFGGFVRSLRQLRLYVNEEEMKQWTQKYLAARADEAARELGGLPENGAQHISTQHIARLEQGKIRDVSRFLAPLARAFELNEGEKEYFYAIAGSVYQSERPIDLDEIEGLFKEIEYPAFARTPLWDFVAFNAYNYVLWGYDDAKLKRLKKPPLGPNVLKVLFDPEFEGVTYKGGQDRWAADISRSIQAFRFESFRHVNSKRHQDIVAAMQQYVPFVTRWNASEPSLDHVNGQPTRPIAKVFHPDYGELEFLSLRTPTKYMGSRVDLSIYVPVTSSVEKYQELQADVKKNKSLKPVYQFDSV